MKAFGNILFTVVLFALGYAIYPSLSDHFGWGDETDSDTSTEIADSSDNQPEPPAVGTTDTTSSGNTTTPKPPNPFDGDDLTATDSTSLEQRFPYPDIKPLDEITANWTAVPERALPQQVTLKKDLQFQLGTTGSVTKPADSDVYVAATSSGMQVRVTMAPNSENEALVSMDDTDFKERVIAMYDKGVAGIRARVDAQRDAERARIASASTITDAEKAAVRQPTTTASNDEIEIMKASIASGELEGLKPSDITTYRKLGFEKASNIVYQVGAAVYDVKTMFGTFQTEAKAFIRDGKVIRWERVDD